MLYNFIKKITPRDSSRKIKSVFIRQNLYVYFVYLSTCTIFAPDFGVTVSRSRAVSKREFGVRPELYPQL